MKHPVLEWRKSESHRAAAFEVGAVEPAIHFAAERFLRLLDRDEIVGHVDDAANRARAEENRRRAPHDFDALAEQSAYAWGVIGTQIRDVENFGAVVQDPNAIISLTANNRAACAGGKPARSDAWLRRQRIAQRRLCPQLEVIFTENGDWLCLVGFALLDRAATDDDALGLSRAGGQGRGFRGRPR